jgi:hypothetical protein
LREGLEHADSGGAQQKIQKSLCKTAHTETSPPRAQMVAPSEKKARRPSCSITLEASMVEHLKP